MGQKKKILHKEVSPEKRKDMIESILPCKAGYRKQAFDDKRKECRRVRHTVRRNLKTCDQEGYTELDLNLLPDQSVTVSNRRFADKTNHFMRWGDQLTEGMSREEALNYMRQLLPRNVIGDHAYSHWEIHKGKFSR